MISVTLDRLMVPKSMLMTQIYCPHFSLVYSAACWRSPGCFKFKVSQVELIIFSPGQVFPSVFAGLRELLFIEIKLTHSKVLAENTTSVSNY